MRDIALIVDDVEMNREILMEILEDEYKILEAEDGAEAMRLIDAHHQDIAVVLLDIVMPEMDGAMLLKKLKEKGYQEEFPVLLVTGEASLELVEKCFENGASDFIRKPVSAGKLRERILKLTKLYGQKDKFEEQMERQKRTLKSQYQLLQKHTERQKLADEKIIDILGTVIEYRNLEGGNHIPRIKKYTKILARQLMEDNPEYDLTEHRIKVIVAASALHDVGKIMIPDSILLKSGKLTQEETEYLESHTIRGCEIIADVAESFEWNKEYSDCCMEIARSHHEKFDGSGYPDGLVGDKIPISAQIVSLADCYETLISENIHHSAVSAEEAYNRIIQGACGVFSGKLLECFRKSRKAFEEE